METKKIGQPGAGFALKDHNGKEIALQDFKGKKVLLSFHPLAWTKICKLQMQSLEENLTAFTKLNTVPLGFSVDSVPCKSAWAKDINIQNVSLPCDFWPHGGVAQKYGLFREKEGFSERANVILDEEGKIIFYKIYELKELPDINEVIGFLENNK
ncbi:MAG: redoxin domain-containing protein [Peptococcaceae bacterium]